MKIAIATTTRADWGLLSPLAVALRERGHDVLIMAANMHYNPALGNTVSEIYALGFRPVLECKTHGSPAEVAAACLTAYNQSLTEWKPECIICLGDRFEMLSIAQAAVMAGVPIVHIAGGAVSEGAMDDLFRHAITKLSYLHFTECGEYRRRVISMGEHPDRVIDTGAISIHNILSIKPVPRNELEADLGVKLDNDTLICTMHAATQDSHLTPIQQYDSLLCGIELATTVNSDLRLIFTHPNNDVDPVPLIRKLREFAGNHQGRAVVIPSLGMKRYLSAIQYVGGVIGNSSSGIVEVASLGKPVLDIGIRQQGRMRAPSVLHCQCSPREIAEGIAAIQTAEIQILASKRKTLMLRLILSIR